MKIYAVRHGQTDYNQKRLVQGFMDNPLNDEGINQAIRMGHYLKKRAYPINHIITSPLIRAHKTASIIKDLAYPQLQIELAPSFIERDFGFFEGKSVDETIKVISQFGFTHDNYEDNDVFLKRIAEGLTDLYQEQPNNHVLLTAHSHTIKALLILADPNTYHFMTFLNNASLCVFDYDGKTLSVDEFNVEAE